MNTFFEKYANNQKLNIIIGDFLNQICEYPTRSELSDYILNELSKNSKIYKKDKNSLSELIQAYLDAVIDNKKNLLLQLNSKYEYKYSQQTKCYEDILKSNHFDTILTINFDNLAERNFLGDVHKLTPFNFKKPIKEIVKYYKIFGDIDNLNNIALSSQDIKKLMLFDTYREYFDMIREELRTRPTLCLGINLEDSDFINIFSYILDGVPDHQPIYFALETTIFSSKINDFTEKYNIQLIYYQTKSFLEYFTMKNTATNGVLDLVYDSPKNVDISSTTSELTLNYSDDRNINTDYSAENLNKKAEETSNELKIENVSTTMETQGNNCEIIDSKILASEDLSTEIQKIENIANVSDINPTVIIDSNTKVIEIVERKNIETGIEIYYSSLKLKSFPIIESNLPIHCQSTENIGLGSTDITIGNTTIYNAYIKITSYEKFRLLEFKTREFKIGLSIELFDGKLQKNGDYFKYEIFSGLTNQRLLNVATIFKMIFSGQPINFKIRNLLANITFENQIECSKFNVIQNSVAEYDRLNKHYNISKNKNFSSGFIDFYSLHLLTNYLNEKFKFDTWANFKIPKNDVNPGDTLHLIRTYKIGYFELKEIIKVKEPISINEIKEGAITCYRKLVEIELEKITK